MSAADMTIAELGARSKALLAVTKAATDPEQVVLAMREMRILLDQIALRMARGDRQLADEIMRSLPGIED